MTPGIAGLPAALILLASTGFVHGQKTPQYQQLRLSPQQAVMNAAESPGGVTAVFEMVVRQAGRQDGMLYLNSEKDYRDPRNLTLVVSPSVERELAARLSGPLEQTVVGKTVAVRGTARKQKIVFISNGVPTEKYYFQTHLAVMKARDLTVAGEQPRP